jgi:hypothetical protein
MGRGRDELPDMAFIRREIPIIDVATSLGIRVAGRNVAHCWRVGAHRHGDQTPSVSFHRNRAKCHVCDVDALSPIDLVINYNDCSLHEAVAWICERWTVPSIAKNKKLSRPERWQTSRVGISAFPLEKLVRSGAWAETFDDAARAILPVLFCFEEAGEVAISYAGLRRYSGKSSPTTIARVLRHFAEIGLLEALPKTHSNFREVRRYRFTLESSKLQTVLLRVHEHLEAERDQDRRLRSELKEAHFTPTRNLTPNLEPAYPGTTLSTPLDCDQSSRSSAVDCGVQQLNVSEASTESIQLELCTENKATWEPPRFTPVDRELELAQRIALNPTVARMKQVFNARIVEIVDLKQQAANGLKKRRKLARRRGNDDRTRIIQRKPIP